MENFSAASSKLKEIKGQHEEAIYNDVPLRIFLGKLDWWLMGAMEGDGGSINRVKKCSDEFAGIILSISAKQAPEYIELKDKLVCFAEKYLPIPDQT
jgi:hypothetical protein